MDFQKKLDFDQCIEGNYNSKLLKVGSSRQDIKEEFIRSYQTYEKLFEILANDQVFYERPQPRRHQLIFYYGHTACVYMNKLLQSGIIKERLNAEYQELFATGVDQYDWDDLDQTHYKWPTVPETRLYRNDVKKIVLEVIDEINPQISWNGEMWAILMGIQHQRIHLETSAVIIRQLPMQKIKSSEILYDCPYYITDKAKIPQNQLQTIPAYKKKWQRQRQNTITYGWDNQYGDKQIDVKEFQVSKMLVSNGQFLQFYEDNGYDKLQFWSQEGIKWLKQTGVKKPVFWRISQSKLKLKTMNKIIDLPLDWPVEVNNLQAQAFCNWKSKKTGKNYKLPTQDQYYSMLTNFTDDWTKIEKRQGGNMDLQYWCSPCPVNMFKFNNIYDVVGNLYELTSTPNHGFKNFQYHPLFEDFSTPFFDGRYTIMKGGSFITNKNCCFNARHGFRRHFYQFTGFRYAISQNVYISPDKEQQSDKMLDLSIKLHYTQKDSYVMKVSQKIKRQFKDLKGKSLVVGCSVGRIPFQLSQVFDHSSGLDFTARFFEVGCRMLQKKYMTYKNQKVSIEDCNFDRQKNHTIRMSPVNIHAGKLSTYNMIVFDGFALRPDTMKIAIPNFIPFLEDNAFLVIINAESRNVMQEEDVYKVNKSLVKVQKQQIGEVEGKYINIEVYHYQNK